MAIFEAFSTICRVTYSARIFSTHLTVCTLLVLSVARNSPQIVFDEILDFVPKWIESSPARISNVFECLNVSWLAIETAIAEIFVLLGKCHWIQGKSSTLERNMRLLLLTHKPSIANSGPHFSL